METRRAILVIDDERPVYESIRRIFSPDREVEWACDLIEAKDKIAKDGIALAIVDLHLNGASPESGEMVAARLRVYRPHLPVIVLSAFLELSIVIDLARLGVRVFMPKPFEVPDIIEAVENEIAEAHKLAVYRERTRPVRFAQIRRIADKAAQNAVRYSRPVTVILGVIGAAAMWLWSHLGGAAEWLNKWR